MKNAKGECAQYVVPVLTRDGEKRMDESSANMCSRRKVKQNKTHHEHIQTTHKLDLAPYGITVETIYRNLAPAQLYEHAIRYEPGSSIADSGALVAYSGEKTGRSPKDKRIVKHPDSEKDVWWGPVNLPIDEHGFRVNRERAIDYLNTSERLYVVDAFAGWHPQHRLKIRVVCSRPYHALFMHTMLIRPTRRGTGVIRRAGLRDLQRGPLPGEPAHGRHDLEDVDRPLLSRTSRWSSSARNTPAK
jgi:hypothetical protein